MPLSLKRLSILVAGISLALGATSAVAQANWPDKPVRFVVPFTPGGGTDAVTRNIAEKITQDTKWTFLIDNKPGAGGNIGLDSVAKAKPDGYTIGMGQTSNLAINPAAIANMPFDATRDFVPVALVAEVPMILVVKADAPYRSLPDLVAAARAKPGQLKQAVAGLGTVGHVAGEMLGRKAGVKTLVIPYKGAAPAITELLGGQTDFMLSTPQGALQMVKGGKLRALAVTSTKRLAALPHVPTVAESGYKDFEAVDWKAIVAPAGTPADVIKRLNAATLKALANPAFIAQLATEGSTPMGGDADKAANYIKAEQVEWAAVVREAGIKLD